MKITVTFDSLDEFFSHIRMNEGFFEPEPERADPMAEAKETLARLQAEAAQEATGAPEGFQPEDKPPFDEKPEESAEKAVNEDYRVEVRKFLAKLNKMTGKNTASELIRSFGCEKLTEVALADLPALMEKAKEVYDAG